MIKRTFMYKAAILLIMAVLLAAQVPGAAAAGRPVVVIEADGTITAGLLSFIQRQVAEGTRQEAQLVVIILNTPGGLVDATLKINEEFLNAPVPIAVLVAPAGAIAASAGVFILMAADIAAAAPGTTIGAAHPVAVGPEGATPADEKTTSLLAKHLRGLAREKERPEDIAEQFVTENLTLDGREALEAGVIEYLAEDLDALLLALDGLNIEKQGRSHSLRTAGAPVRVAEMNLRERLQHWLSDPQIAFVLLMLGVMGIYLGINAPGTFVPEVIGAILLVMGIYGIGLFDTSTTGILLLLLGIGLIIAEIFTAGFGVFGIGGGICLVAGAILLPLEPLMSPDWYVSFRLTAAGIALGVTLLILVIAQRVWHSRRRWREGSEYFQPPVKGTVVEALAPQGMIRARGELWKARSDDGSVIDVGVEVEVVRAENLTLWVRPVKVTGNDEEV